MEEEGKGGKEKGRKGGRLPPNILA